MMKLRRLFEHEIRITSTVNYGIIAQVGCATLIYDGTPAGRAALLKDLGHYLESPKTCEREYRELNKDYGVVGIEDSR